MKDLSKGFARVLFWFVGAAVIAWTSRMTYTLLNELLPDLLYSGLFGLVLYEVGMMAWLYMFINGSEGQGQRITAILLTVFDLLGVGLVSMVKLFISGQELAQTPEGLPTLALWVVVISTFANLSGIVIYHLLDPQAQEQIAIQAQKDKLRARTLETFSQKIDQVADGVSDDLADSMRDNLLASMRASLNAQNGTTENPTRIMN